nr:unnamed protein product [Digitaria exilis]
MTADRSNTEPHLEHFAPFLIDKKTEQAAGSAAEKCIASEKLPSSNNTSGSCPAVGNYFESVHDSHSMDKLNVHSVEVDSRNLNSEPFTELAPLQNIYVTDSYNFEQDNKESGVGITSEDSKICHINENKVEGGLHELQTLSCAGQSLGAVNLSNQVSNESLLPESSDGLLEAITNPVKLHRSDGSNRVNNTLQPSLSPLQHGSEVLNSGVDRSNELIVDEFGTGSTSALSHRPEADSRNSHPHLVSSLSPKRTVADATGIPEETKNDGVNNTNISCTGDESKPGVLEHHQDSADSLKSGDIEENTFREEMPAVSGHIEQMVENDHEENATGATGTSKGKVDSSDSIAPGNFSSDTFNVSENSNIPSTNHEESFKELDTPALEEDPENTHMDLSTSGHQEKMVAPAAMISSRSGITSITVTDTLGTSKDKNVCSIAISADDSSALPDEKELKVSTMNHEGPFNEGAKSAVGDEEHNVISPGSEPGREMSDMPVDSNVDVYNVTVSVSKEEEHKEQASLLGGSNTGEAEDKSGNSTDTSEKCQTDKVVEKVTESQATPPALGISTGKVVEKVTEIPPNASDDMDTHAQDTVLNHGTDRSPGPGSQGEVGSGLVEPGKGNGICTRATCGSPSVISCAESPQEGGQGSNALLCPLDGQSGPKDCEDSADAAQQPKQCSTSNVESAPDSEETNTAGGDRRFSFEVGARPNVSEKAHSPLWSPFPRYEASQSIEVTSENPQPGSSMRPTSDDSKKTSIVKAGKEQLPESAGGPSDNSNIGDSTKVKSSPPEQSQQHPTPECSDLVNFPFTDPQHLQLRAQIFVYGALIQGAPPGEPYMVAAFGEPVGDGKPAWEAPWRAAVERFLYQKSLYAGLETPTSSRIATSIVSSPMAGVDDKKQKMAGVDDKKQKAPASSSKHGTSQKPRKRKKASASPEQQPVFASPQLKLPEQQSIFASPQLKTEITSFTAATKPTAGFTLSTHSPSNPLGGRVVPNTGQITLVPNYQITGGADSEQRIIFSEHIRGAIEQTTGQAKGASMHSLEAIRHHEGIWSHLSTISRNKLPQAVEEKLTSAVAAAEAAVSVAKAAAEAAKMASDAALQAKMMAEEALSSSISLKPVHNEAGEFNISSNPPGLPSSTPASSLKTKDNTHAPGPIISVAREAARKRVEEASAAAKRAENLDAILKAAELAAEAVFKAGTIIGMGEPLPFTLRELLEAGPDGYWKSENVKNKAGVVKDNPVTETLEAVAPANFSKSGRKRGRKPKSDQAIPNLEPSLSGKELHSVGIHSGHGVEDVPATVPLDGNRVDTAPINFMWNGIEKGSAVEVLSDKGGFGVAWFSAKVIDINENNAFVSYDNHNVGGGGELLAVDGQGLRPSRVWKDGQWIEWSRARERKSKSNKGDSPLEKRQRTDLQADGDLSIGCESGGPSKDKNTNNTKMPEEPKPLALSQRDMVFNIGKSVVENRSDALAFKRPGLQKEGSKVVYGVPKHGKKKKFMELLEGLQSSLIISKVPGEKVPRSNYRSTSTRAQERRELAVEQRVVGSSSSQAFGMVMVMPILPQKSRRSKGNQEKMAEIFDKMKVEFVDQDESVQAVADNIRDTSVVPERDTLDKYSLELANLSVQLFKFMANNLGVNQEALLGTFKGLPQSMRINHYPSCSQADKVLGLSPHTDGVGMTFLLQVNDVEGLQIKKDDKWFSVKAIPGAFVVNIGDALEILTNGKYKSTEHRAVINPTKERITIATFLSVQLGCMIGPLQELLKAGEARYKTLDSIEFTKGYFAAKLEGRRSNDKIPERYVRKEVRSEELIAGHGSTMAIPVIDLNKLLDPQSLEECVKLASACENWGFFQLINHGVPDEVTDNLMNDIAEFFEQPLEAKKAYSQLPNSLEGYGQSFVVSENQKLDWCDRFFLLVRPVESRDLRFWPTTPASFRHSVDVYSSEVAKLSCRLLEFMAKGVGAEPTSLLGICEGQHQGMRMNYYPPCWQADRVLGLSPHSDASGLTLLLQKKGVQGLQVKRDGKWFPVDALDGAFIVNVGDVLEILSNEKFRSVEHRAVIHQNKERISVAIFQQPCQDLTVGPLPEFVKGDKVRVK